MAQTTIGVPAGAQAEQFLILQDYGIHGIGDLFVCDTVCSRGTLVYLKSAGVVSPVIAAQAVTTRVMGFIMQNVVAAGGFVDLQFGENATVSVDLVTVQQVGQAWVTNVSGSIGAGAIVYPAANGGVSATQSTGANPVGTCLVGNTGSGAPIRMQFNFLG